MTATALLMAATAASGAPREAFDGKGEQPFSIEALGALARVGDPAVSPDGKTVLFGIGYQNLAENNTNTDLYLLSLDTPGAAPRQITDTPKSENSYTWLSDGRIAFMYPDSEGLMQLWTMNADGSGRKWL